MLEAAEVAALVDVRSVPRSRRHPQFTREALTQSLPAHGLDYRHEPRLGGFRRPSSDSRNTGWEHPAFRGYADYMTDHEFVTGLEDLLAGAVGRSTCVMCAEAQWWRCHRRLIADALLIRGWTVLHLGLRAKPVSHELTPFAVVGPEQSISYPSSQGAFELE